VKKDNSSEVIGKQVMKVQMSCCYTLLCT